MQIGQHEEAIEDYTKAIELASQKDKPSAYMTRSSAYKRIGREAESKADLNKGCELEKYLVERMLTAWGYCESK